MRVALVEADRSLRAATMKMRAWVHPASVRRSTLAGTCAEIPATFRPVTAPLSRIVVDVTGPAEMLASAREGLPDGAAAPEAIAVRLRRSGVELKYGTPRKVDGLAALLELSRERGASSVEIMRADPTLLPELQLGSWFNWAWRGRLARRLLYRVPALARAYGQLTSSRLAAEVAADTAFWAGVRSAATSDEWRRLTRSSYVMLVYHRLADDGRSPVDKFDLDPRRFFAQVRVLRMLGFRPLAADEILKFHSDPRASLPARSYAITFDDGFVDCVDPLRRIPALGAQLFVSTREVGKSATWAGGEPIMDWKDVIDLAARGISVGAHARRHLRLPALSQAELDDEVAGALADLRENVPGAIPVLAYPHGAHDERVRSAAIAAGFAAAYTSEKGRNGAGTDRHCLRRIAVHASDGRVTTVWKVITGEGEPRFLNWVRRREHRGAGSEGTSRSPQAD